MSHKLKELANIARNPGWLCFVWFGMTAGISLLEGSVKFSAPTLTRILPSPTRRTHALN